MDAIDPAFIKQRIVLARADHKPWSGEQSQSLQDPKAPLARVTEAEVEPWEFLDRKLNTFSRLVEEQQRFLVDMQEIVRVQMNTPRPTEMPMTPPVHFSASASHTAALSRFSTASQSRLITSTGGSSKRGMDSGNLPVLNVYHHGNNNGAMPSSTSHVAIEIPPINQGFMPWANARLLRVVDSSYFEPTMACIIGLNAVNIGITIDLELRGCSTEINAIVENIFLVIFAVELALRVAARGWRSLMTLSAAVDSFIIILTLVTEVIKPMLPADKPLGRFLDQVLVLRMARLLRLARSARLVACLESLWKLAHGLVRCVGTMGSACVLMFITIYIFACFGAELIAKPHMNDPAVGALLREHFASMPKILLTLFQFVSMDSTAPIYFPLIEHSPFLALYFWLLLIIVPIALLNLITAILVEDVISTVQADEEMKQIHRRRTLKQLVPALRELFVKFDTSNDGFIQIREVADAINDGIDIPEPLQAFLDPARMMDLFDALDADNSGELSEEEFVDGLTYVAMSDVRIETIQILHLLRSLRRDLDKASPSSNLCWSQMLGGRPSFNAKLDVERNSLAKSELDIAKAEEDDEANPELYLSQDSEGALAI